MAISRSHRAGFFMEKGAPVGRFFYLKRKLMSIAVGASTSIRQPLKTAFLIAIENLVTGLPSNSKFSAKFRHRLAGWPASHKLQSLMHYRTLLPRHHSLPKRGKSVTYVSGTICYLCLRSLKNNNLAYKFLTPRNRRATLHLKTSKQTTSVRDHRVQC
jgi:hypothetical protein